jgi:hypothetical protein
MPREIVKNCLVCLTEINRRGMDGNMSAGNKELKESRSDRAVTCCRGCSKVYTRIHRHITNGLYTRRKR